MQDPRCGAVSGVASLANKRTLDGIAHNRMDEAGGSSEANTSTRTRAAARVMAWAISKPTIAAAMAKLAAVPEYG